MYNFLKVWFQDIRELIMTSIVEKMRLEMCMLIIADIYGFILFECVIINVKLQ